MGDTLLNGRHAEDFELAAIAHGRRCDLERDLRDKRLAAGRRRVAAALVRCMDQRDQAGADAILARHAGDADAVAAWVWRIEAERAAHRRVYRASPGWRSDRDAAGMRVAVAVRELVELVAAEVSRAA